MVRYISLLLFIGLAWGQEYDPETGEVVKKQYDPETGELIKDQNYPDSLVSPSHPKVNSDLKNISISHLTKEQKKKYNQNRITMLVKNPIDWSIYRGQEELYLSEFFIFTGYPEKAEIAKHNQELRIKNSVLGTLIYYLGLGIADGIENPIGMVISFGGAGYFYYDYIENKYELPNYEKV